MAASITDKWNQGTASTRPVPTTLTATRSIGDGTITCGALTGWPTSTAVHFIIYTVDTSGNKVAGSQTDWKGIVSGTTITGLVLKAGSDAGDSIGAIVECGPTAAWANDIVAGAIVDHDQLGQHKTLTDANGNEWIKQTATASAVNELTVANAATGNSPILSATGGDTNVGLTLTPKGTGNISMTSRADGWVTGLTAPNTVTANGNRSYDMVFNTLDYTDRLSPGMRLKLTRTVSAPTQCTSLNGTTQYYSKASPNKLTFTDDFVVSAWIKLTSYAVAGIVSRYNGTSGWDLIVGGGGVIQMRGFNAGAANTSTVTSYQSIPLNKWVHVAAQLDMSTFTATTTTSYVMLDGVDVPAVVARGGTNPTALIQAGDLQIGASNAGAFFPGKIAQVAVYNAKVTQATILASMHQTLTGSETSLASAYSFNNSIADLNTTTPNDLTAQGSAVATSADSPFALDAQGVPTGTTEYAVVTKTAFSTNTTLTVQVPEGGAIPTSGGVSALSYSTQERPYGMPLIGNVLGDALMLGSVGTSSGTVVAASGLKTTVYLPSKCKVKVTLNVPRVVSDAGTYTNMSIWEGAVSTGIAITGSTVWTINSGAYRASAACLTATYTPVTSGATTFTVGFYAEGGGTSTLYGNTYPIVFSVELL